MRYRAALIVVVPTILAAQDSIRQQASPALEDWRRQQMTHVASYEMARTKSRAEINKGMLDLERKIEAWVQIARDEYGGSEANRMDPSAMQRFTQARRAQIVQDDTSASELSATRRTADFDNTLAAFHKRRRFIEEMLVAVDTIVGEAKRSLRFSLSNEEKWKAEDRPGLDPSTRQAVKSALDWYAKLIRALRAELDLQEKRISIFRDELKYLDQQIAAASALVGR